MTLLYSLNNSRPAPLPFRIRLPGGATRTDPTSFTDDEITAAGYTGPYSEPPYDPATEQLQWADGAYSVVPLPPPPPQPDWPRFKLAAFTSADIKASLATALGTDTTAATALAATLLRAEQGDVTDFAVTWAAVMQAAPLAPEVLTELVSLAQECELPEVFVASFQAS